ncbi:MAG: NUDIX hydrolase [Actinomycetes bacterium]
MTVWPIGADELAPVRDAARSAARIDEARLDAPDQRSARERVRSLLVEHGEALADRTTAPGHLTGSAVVVDADCERVLVLLHTKLQRWLQPGGHADGDHELAGVALREASEESGIAGLRVVTPAIDLDVHRVDHGDALGEHLHLDLRFVVLAPEGSIPVGNHESQAIRWVTLDELSRFADEPGLLRLARLGLETARRSAT